MTEGLPVYLDYAATTPVDSRVAASMMRFLDSHRNFGNPASRTHRYGWDAQAAVENARSQVAKLIQADPAEIIWTSGATESNNLAVKGVAEQTGNQKRHILTTQIEHKSVLEPCEFLSEHGYEISYLKVLPNGKVDISELEKQLRSDTALVSVMHVNNEIGVIQDIAVISGVVRRRGILFHVDAAQSIGKITVDVSAVPVDLMSMSAHKVYGPKGAGALYVRRGVRHQLVPQLHGGGHEQGLRAGTIAPHQVVGMGEACSIAQEQMAAEYVRLEALRTRLCHGLLSISGVKVNGALAERVPHILSVSFAGIAAETLLSALTGIAISAGSACSSGSVEPSHVLIALGQDRRLALSTLRFSLGRFTTEADVDRTITHVNETVAVIRG